MLNTTILGYCNTLATVLDQIIDLFSQVLKLVGLTSISIPNVQSICSSLFAGS